MANAAIEGGYKCVRYFCTTGSGLEQFLVEEVKDKALASDVSGVD